MYATNITWDVDYDDRDHYLPTTVKIPDELETEDEIADYLSDLYDFLFEDFQLIYE